MMSRRQYEMSVDDLARIIEASKPVPYLVFGGMPPRSQQENANAAWRELGARLGFDAMSVQPVGSDPRNFTAEEKP